MNALAEKFGDKLAILGFPCNQFGHQTNENDFEFLNTLKYVRPGDGYEPNFPIFTKMAVNGESESEIFNYLKAQLPTVSDDKGGNGSDHITDMSIGQPLLWKPLRRTDITWNFEKFIIDQDGKPVKRYSPKFVTEELAEDLATLIEGGPGSLA